MRFFLKHTPRIVFVNGICTTLENAKRDAESLSSHSELIWNPTAWEGIYQNDEATSAKGSIDQLKAIICQQLMHDQPICIVAHSKGCHITWKVLESLYPKHHAKMQQLLYLYMFGGVALLPNHFGKIVENWKSYGSFRIQDGYADLGGEWLRLTREKNLHTWTSIRRHPEIHDRYTLKMAENAYSALWHHHSFRKAYLEIAQSKVVDFEQKHLISGRTWKDYLQVTKRVLSTAAAS